MLTIKMRYMKYLRILTIAAAASFALSCQRDDAGQYERTDDAPIKFKISIEQGASSRLNNDDVELRKTTFDIGDDIGIWVMKRPIYQTDPMLPIEANYSEVRLMNYLLRYMGDGEWRFKNEEDQGIFIKLLREPGYRYDYYAYYKPIKGAWNREGNINSGVNPWALSYSATSGKNIVNEDFLVAVNTDCPDGTTVVNLNFTHLLSLFEVRQPGLGSNASVKLFAPKIIASGKGDFTKLPSDPDFFRLDGQYDEGAQVVKSIEFKCVSNGRYRLFLPPQSIETGDDTYLEICYDKNAKTDANTVIYKLSPNNAENNAIVFERGTSRYLETIPEYNPKLVNTPNSILFTSRLGQTKRVPVAKAYAMWQTDPVLKATNPNLYGNVSLKMLWSDTPNFTDIFSVALDNANKGAGAKIEMKLKGSSGAVLYEANAVYGLYIGDTLRWSWHLWAATNARPDMNTFTGPDGSVFMTANLGAWPSKASKVNGEWTALSGATRGLLYQWGRKDPFPGAAYDGWDFAKYQPVYNDTAAVINTAYAIGVPTSSMIVNADSAAMNPMAFSTAWNPTGTLPLWNVAPDHVNNNKSPYDPCPVGWRVGASESNPSVWAKPLAGTSLADYTANTWNNGIQFEKTDYLLGYYPQTNCRSISGELAATGTISMWHGGPTGNSFTIDRASSQVNTAATNDKKLGMAVRCVKYDTDKEIWDTTIDASYYVWRSFAGELEYK